MSSSRHVLIVDDNTDSCDLLSFMLSKSDKNLIITAAPTAEKALILLDTQKFDLFILDYHLPQMSGIELCRQLRSDGSQTPIMFFTAMAYQKDRDRAMEAGADEYLIKPNDFMKIAETVKNLLEKPSSIVENNFINNI